MIMQYWWTDDSGGFRLSIVVPWPSIGLSYQSMMTDERMGDLWNDNWQGETEVLGDKKKSPRRHLVHHKSHTDRPWIETSNQITGQRSDYVDESLYVAKYNYEYNIEHRVVGLLNEWEEIWKEEAVAYSRYYTGMCLQGLREIVKNLSQGSRCTGRGSNRKPSE
jgi:hypothetical protein